MDVDLNSIEVYSNGSLVYQPCLKIPFTESKTGSKIVNSIYRDRVNDMASQFGYAPYYTLLEEDTGRYTVVGSPTISSDFVASGLDTSNYLYITPEQKSYNNLIINFNYVYSASGNINAYGTIGNFYQIYNNGTGASELKLITYESGNAVPKTITINGMTQTVGVEYNVKIIINNLNVRYSVTNLSTGVEVHNDTTLNEAFTIGSGFPKALVLYNVQSADYKKAYIIADGNTYKAVEPPDFTLPQGEVYGLIEKVPRQIIYEANWDDYAANTKYTFDLTSEYISDIDVTHWNIEVWAKIKTTAVGGFNAGAVFLLSSQNQYGGTDQYEHGVGIIIENKVLTMWTGQLVNMRSGNGANYNNVQLKIVIKAMEEI